MVTSEALAQLFPRQDDIPAEQLLPEQVHQRGWLVDGELREWPGPFQPVLSAVCVRGQDGKLAQVELGSVPQGGEAEAEVALAAAVAAYDNGRGAWPTMAVAERIACMQAFAKQMQARAQRGRAAADVGDRQEPGRSREGVRPHRRLHPRHHRGAQGAGQRQLALPRRRGHDRPDPAHAPGRGAVHGPVQLPAQRDLRDADPGADHGQHRGVQAAALRRAAVRAAARGVPQRLPPGRDQHRLRQGLGRGAAAAGHRQGQLPDPDRLEQGRRPSEEAAAQGAPAARDPRAWTPRTPPSSCRTPISSSRSRSACSARSRSTASAARRSRCCWCIGRSPSRSCAGSSRSWPSSRSACRGSRASASRRCPSPARSPTWPSWCATPWPRARGWSTRAAAASAGTLFYPAVVYPVAEGMKLYREEQFGPVVPVMPFDELETALEYVITSEHGQQVSIFSADPGADRDAGRPAGQSGLPGQHQLPVPARAGRVPVHRPQGFGGGHAVGDRRAALVLHPLDGGDQADGASEQLLDAIVQHRTSKFINTGFIF